MRLKEPGTVNVVEMGELLFPGLLISFLFLRDLMIFHLCPSMHLLFFSFCSIWVRLHMTSNNFQAPKFGQLPYSKPHNSYVPSKTTDCAACGSGLPLCPISHSWEVPCITVANSPWHLLVGTRIYLLHLVLPILGPHLTFYFFLH